MNSQYQGMVQGVLDRQAMDRAGLQDQLAIQANTRANAAAGLNARVHQRAIEQGDKVFQQTQEDRAKKEALLASANQLSDSADGIEAMVHGGLPWDKVKEMYPSFASGVKADHVEVDPSTRVMRLYGQDGNVVDLTQDQALSTAKRYRERAAMVLNPHDYTVMKLKADLVAGKPQKVSALENAAILNEAAKHFNLGDPSRLNTDPILAARVKGLVKAVADGSTLAEAGAAVGLQPNPGSAMAQFDELNAIGNNLTPEQNVERGRLARQIRTQPNALNMSFDRSTGTWQAVPANGDAEIPQQGGLMDRVSSQQEMPPAVSPVRAAIPDFVGPAAQEDQDGDGTVSPEEQAYNMFALAIQSGVHPNTGKPLSPSQILKAKEQMKALKMKIIPVAQ